MSLQQILKNRLALEQKNQLPHDRRFDEQVKREQHSILLLIAVLTACVYALGLAYFHKTVPKVARPGEILAKSEMSKKEIKQLNIAKALPEKVNER